VNPVSPTTSGLAVDPSALNALKYSAGKAGEGGKAALKDAARQFEALFMRELIKSMRDATQKSGLLEGQGSDLGTDLLDQQLSVQLAGMPGGLSQAIERQLGRQMGGAAADPPDAGSEPPAFKPLSRQGLQALMKYAPAAGAAASSSAGGVAANRPATARQAAFVEKHSEAAAEVAREVGIPAAYMIGQAGHETGWGRSEIRHRDGSPSHNLFGIKATAGWKGPVAEVTTTEYVDGVPRKSVARFRAYDSYADAFRDYARLIGQSPRYEKAMDQIGSVQGFATSLQKAGYATDPQYALKLGRAINAALDLQRVVAQRG
jgi:peptidoglycan hydrolase FlgJ